MTHTGEFPLARSRGSRRTARRRNISAKATQGIESHALEHDLIALTRTVGTRSRGTTIVQGLAVERD